MNDLERLLEMSGVPRDHNDLMAELRAIEELTSISKKYQFHVDKNGKISVYNNDASQRWFFNDIDDMLEKGLRK